MWILEALSRVPLKRLFLLLSATLGAAFLLLAQLFSIRALTHPLTYTLLAMLLYLAQRPEAPVWKVCVLLPAGYGLAYWLHPHYAPLFAASFTLTCGWLLFRNGFRVWKWIASAVLFFLSLMIVAVWERMDLVQSLLPAFWSPLVYGLIFSFCAGFSFLPYLLRKDRVQEAADAHCWQPRSEAEAMVKQTGELYAVVRRQLEDEPKLQDDLEELCERIVHLCKQLQTVTAELARTKPEELEAQAGSLHAKAESVADPVAKKQYEQALSNKRKQQKQYESLQNKAERLRGQILHYLSGLENMRFAYANREFRSAGDSKETLEFFMNVARADNVYDTTEAYQDLL